MPVELFLQISLASLTRESVLNDSIESNPKQRSFRARASCPRQVPVTRQCAPQLTLAAVHAQDEHRKYALNNSREMSILYSNTKVSERTYSRLKRAVYPSSLIAHLPSWGQDRPDIGFAGVTLPVCSLAASQPTPFGWHARFVRARVLNPQYV